VKLDLLYEIDAPRPWEAGPHPWGQRAREQRAYGEMLDQVKLADELGFNVAWFVEHHFREGRSHCPAPEVVIGALTQVTRNLRLGFGVTLLPYGFTHPARVAEKVATADILSQGRIEWGTGRSTPMEQTAFHVDREASRAEWAEAIEIICSMWREEYFEWDSPTFQFPRRLITPKPYQDPHPPAWMAATSEGSSAVAGSNQLGLLSFSIMQPLDKMAAQIRAYRDAWNSPEAKPISDVATNKVAAYTLVHCAETNDQARDNGVWDSVAWWYQNIAQFTLDWELPHLDPAAREAAFPLLTPLMEGNIPIESFDTGDMIVVGDPDRCFEKMKYTSVEVGSNLSQFID
jgi:alkanesulfonate monooxygenase SsuD/methylene tetrahydromethanopterin reductase-like flavin-dependent oxidoreductase (luciferase family)